MVATYTEMFVPATLFVSFGLLLAANGDRDETIG